MMRIFLAALLGSIAMYFWTYVAYTKLPLGDTGIRNLPDETAVLNALQKNIAEESGVYVFPRPKKRVNSTDQEKVATPPMTETVARYPSGFLIYNAAGSRPFALLRWRLVDFLTKLAEAVIVIFLLSRTRQSTFGGRVRFVVGTGILVAIASNVPYWNWYGFSASYVLAYMSIQVVGFLCLGLVAAFVLKGYSFETVRKPNFILAMSRVILGH
jgi:hypothetical protein